MARVTHVKKAQQRYEQVPVIDPATGEQKATQVFRSNGEPKKTKRGALVFMKQTVADKSKPLPPLTCDSCGEEIEIGTPYKHVTPKSGPYGGRQRNRHASCPSWKSWELSSSWSARVEQATYDFNVTDCETKEDVEAALSEVAEAIRELASESEQAADSVEEGFGHETFVSAAARERASALEDWADSIESADVPDYPEPEAPEPEQRWYVVNPEDDGGGIVFEDTPEGYETREEAEAEMALFMKQWPNAVGITVEQREYESDEVLDDVTEEQIEEWRSGVEDAVAIVQEVPDI